ncbi:MAG: hypothetical protein M3Z16_02855 [Pseudomonadota bacterium]|nr:hypothetical protein [Pseudomonadota bacterium]
MKVRKVTLFTGRTLRVPTGIQRIDHGSTHGWQLRYGGTKLFSDGTQDGSGAVASLAAARAELLKRIAKLPAPARLQRSPNENKTSALSVGISGPVVRLRKGAKVRDCSFSVSLPRYGATPQRRSVYIGTENTFSTERYNLALAKAVELRAAAEMAYRSAATRAKRAAARALESKRKSG